MSEVRFIELSSLVQRHKELGYDLYVTNGPRIVYRLTNDKLIPATGSRNVRVNWVAKPGRKTARDINVTVRWSDVPDLEKRRPGVIGNANNHRHTEDAAVTLMFLLINEFEGVVIKSVLQIGDGPDYIIYSKSGEMVEVSGINQASLPSESSGRLRKKTDQLLETQRSGYVSVSTFIYPCPIDGNISHSYLHYVFRKVKKKSKNHRKENALTPVVDIDGAASQAALKGKGCANRGDTKGAREHYDKSGEILLGEMSRIGPPARHYLRFLAATQFYEGGNYQKARDVASRIKERYLPKSIRHLFPGFLISITERASQSYIQSTRMKILSQWQSGNYSAVIELLENNQYVYDRSIMAYLLSTIFAENADYSSSTAFFVRAMEFGIPPFLILHIAYLPFVASANGDMEGSWQHAQFMVEAVPHAATYAIAAMILYSKSSELSNADKQKNGELLLSYAKKSLDLLARETDQFKSADWTREFIELMICNAAMARNWVGQKDSNKWVVEEIHKRDFKSGVFKHLSYAILSGTASDDDVMRVVNVQASAWRLKPDQFTNLAEFQLAN